MAYAEHLYGLGALSTFISFDPFDIILHRNQIYIYTEIYRNMHIPMRYCIEILFCSRCLNVLKAF